MIDADEMVALIESCRREMQAMLPADEFASLSSKTRQDYRQLGRTLLQRARYAEGGMAEVITATQRPTTYYKRVAALRYCLYADLVERLKSLQADILKIDGCFVRDIETDPLDAIMVKSIIEMAKVKKMKVVAEYVETPEQREKLLELGVDYLQGYLVGKPLPLSELRA